MSLALDEPMAKRSIRHKAPSVQEGDYFHLRLPIAYRALLEELSKLGSRTMTAEAQIAFEQRARAKQVKFRFNHSEQA